MERCRKPLYLVSDWFVHLPIKYLVNGTKQKRASHWQWKLRWRKNGASIGDVQYLLLQAILTEAMYKPESMAQTGWMTLSILFKVLLIKLIVPVGNKLWCRFCCIQYPHLSHICVENKKWESSKDFKEAFKKSFRLIATKVLFQILGSIRLWKLVLCWCSREKNSLSWLFYFCLLVLFPLDFLKPSYPTARSPHDELSASVVLFPLVQVVYLLVSFLSSSSSILSLLGRKTDSLGKLLLH